MRSGTKSDSPATHKQSKAFSLRRAEHEEQESFSFDRGRAGEISHFTSLPIANRVCHIFGVPVFAWIASSAETHRFDLLAVAAGKVQTISRRAARKDE
jgi:hypothetical protein